MVRVLVVHHDIDLADQEADSLRREGFEVNQCSGPGAYSGPDGLLARMERSHCGTEFGRQ